MWGWPECPRRRAGLPVAARGGGSFGNPRSGVFDYAGTMTRCHGAAAAEVSRDGVVADVCRLPDRLPGVTPTRR